MIASRDANIDVFQVVYLPSHPEKGCVKQVCQATFRYLTWWRASSMYEQMARALDIVEDWISQKGAVERYKEGKWKSLHRSKIMLLIQKYYSSYSYENIFQNIHHGGQEMLWIGMLLIPERGQFPWGKGSKQQNNITCQRSKEALFKKWCSKFSNVSGALWMVFPW